MQDNEKAKSSDHDDVLAVARERFQTAEEAESELRRDALDDLEFRAGKQWPSDVKQTRELDRRPCLTINRLPQFIRQVTNDQRQNRPSIKVNPVDDKADVETAKVLQGLIRHIEYNSNADVAYDTAFEGAATKGLGYLRVVTDYCDPTSFDQEILIKRVRNSFSVFMDPTYQEPDGSDANWAFVVEDMNIDEFRAQFKDSKLSRADDWTSLGNTAPGWTTKSTVRVAEYFTKTFKDTTLVQLSDGSVAEKDQLPPEAEILAMGLSVVNQRRAIMPAIKWYKINGVEILEEREWLGRWIPIIPVLGDELDIDGKRILEGIIRHAKDPQRMYNYWASSETETIALAPRAPFIGAEGQFEGHESTWRTANTRNHAYLQYKPKSFGGQMAPPPQRNVFEPPVQAITQARMQASDDMKATTGMYDAALGARSNENSGIAIQRRNLQAQTSNFHYIDNLSRAMRHLGRVILDLIPHIYDTARTVRIMGEDGQAEMVAINQVFEKGGKQVEYKLGVGKYDVTVSTGPSFQTKRQESVASMIDLAKVNPQLMQIAGDLMIANMDWPQAQEIAQRVKKTLPPGLGDDPKDNEQPIPPHIQGQMQQMNQMLEQLTQQLQAKTQQIEQKTIELESRERIEMAKIQAQVEIEMAKMGSAEAQLLLKQEVAEIQGRLAQLGYGEPFPSVNEPPPFGPEMAAGAGMNQMPTGGPSPGQSMGDIP